MTQSPRQTEEQKPGQQHSGVHNAKPGEKVDSRSADPGQSSYGGFRNEDPSRQVQQDEKGKTGGK